MPVWTVSFHLEAEAPELKETWGSPPLWPGPCASGMGCGSLPEILNYPSLSLFAMLPLEGTFPNAKLAACAVLPRTARRLYCPQSSDPVHTVCVLGCHPPLPTINTSSMEGAPVGSAGLRPRAGNCAGRGVGAQGTLGWTAEWNSSWTEILPQYNCRMRSPWCLWIFNRWIQLADHKCQLSSVCLHENGWHLGLIILDRMFCVES